MALKDKLKVPHPKLPFKKGKKVSEEAVSQVEDVPGEVAAEVQNIAEAPKHTLPEFITELRKVQAGKKSPEELFNQFVK